MDHEFTSGERGGNQPGVTPKSSSSCPARYHHGWKAKAVLSSMYSSLRMGSGISNGNSKMRETEMGGVEHVTC